MDAAAAAKKEGMQKPFPTAAEAEPLGVERVTDRKDHPPVPPEPGVVLGPEAEAGVAGLDGVHRTGKDHSPCHRDRQSLQGSALSEPGPAEEPLSEDQPTPVWEAGWEVAAAPPSVPMPGEVVVEAAAQGRPAMARP